VTFSLKDPNRERVRFEVYDKDLIGVRRHSCPPNPHTAPTHHECASEISMVLITRFGSFSRVEG